MEYYCANEDCIPCAIEKQRHYKVFNYCCLDKFAEEQKANSPDLLLMSVCTHDHKLVKSVLDLKADPNLKKEDELNALELVLEQTSFSFDKKIIQLLLPVTTSCEYYSSLVELEDPELMKQIPVDSYDLLVDVFCESEGISSEMLCATYDIMAENGYKFSKDVVYAYLIGTVDIEIIDTLLKHGAWNGPLDRKRFEDYCIENLDEVCSVFAKYGYV